MKQLLLFKNLRHMSSIFLIFIFNNIFSMNNLGASFLVAASYFVKRDVASGHDSDEVFAGSSSGRIPSFSLLSEVRGHIKVRYKKAGNWTV